MPKDINTKQLPLVLPDDIESLETWSPLPVSMRNINWKQMAITNPSYTIGVSRYVTPLLQERERKLMELKTIQGEKARIGLTPEMERRKLLGIKEPEVIDQEIAEEMRKVGATKEISRYQSELSMTEFERKKSEVDKQIEKSALDFFNGKPITEDMKFVLQKKGIVPDQIMLDYMAYEKTLKDLPPEEKAKKLDQYRFYADGFTEAQKKYNDTLALQKQAQDAAEDRVKIQKENANLKTTIGLMNKNPDQQKALQQAEQGNLDIYTSINKRIKDDVLLKTEFEVGGVTPARKQEVYQGMLDDPIYASIIQQQAELLIAAYPNKLAAYTVDQVSEFIKEQLLNNFLTGTPPRTSATMRVGEPGEQPVKSDASTAIEEPTTGSYTGAAITAATGGTGVYVAIKATPSIFNWLVKTVVPRVFGVGVAAGAAPIAVGAVTISLLIYEAAKVRNNYLIKNATDDLAKVEVALQYLKGLKAKQIEAQKAGDTETLKKIQLELERLRNA